MITLALQVLAAYLIGSVSGSLLLGKLRGVDIREAGSGNAGATNALRTRGKAFALGVLLIDVGKGALAVVLAGWLASLFEGPSIVSALQAGLICGIAATLGHVYPIYYGFRGGKGAATLVGAVLVVLPVAIPGLLLVWIAVILLTGYVGLATVTAAAALLPLTALFANVESRSDYLIFSGVAALLILFTHRSNIVRLLRGKENRFERAIAWRKR